MALPGMDERANAVEYFVHHEDVRRAAPDWEPRVIGRGQSRALVHRAADSAADVAQGSGRGGAGPG